MYQARLKVFIILYKFVTSLETHLLILLHSTWPVAPICGLEQLGSQHCFDLNDSETKRKVNKSTFHKDKVDIESPCFCDQLLSFHRTSNFMHPLISFPICSNYALEVKFLSTLQTYSLLLFNFLLK